MDKFLFVFVLLLFMALPAAANDDVGGDVVDGIVAESVAAGDDVSSDPTDLPSDPTVPVETQEASSDIAVFAVTGDLDGGYYFVCDCALGNDLKFYVPREWAQDAFTYDGSGDLVNLSTSTCYAYCPDYPDYTFSCSRFGTFTYRSSNYDSNDLNITSVSESNIVFFRDSGVQLSDVDFKVIACSLLFVLICITVLKRGA